MLSASIGNLVKKASIKDSTEDLVQDEVVFEINQLVSKTATFYEKVRYLVDYKEEHTIRRSAIERILRRKLFIENSSNNVGLSLISELVGGQYVAEKFHTEKTGTHIDAIVNKFLILYNHTGNAPHARREIYSLAASEIDYFLDTYVHQIDIATVEAFCESVRPHILINEPLSKEQLDVVLYCACTRNLLGSDDQMLAFSLWRKFVPGWESMDEKDIPALGARFGEIISTIRGFVKSPFQWQIAQRLKNETVYFLIIRELVRQYGAESGTVLENQETLDTYVENFMERIYKKENKKIRSRGIRAVAYLFLTKILLALAIELPYEFFVMGSIQTMPLGINIIFPPFLLFVMTRGVRTLDAKNTREVMSGMRTIVYSDSMKPIRVGKSRAQQGLAAVFSVIYILFIASLFGFIVYLLNIIHFNPVSIIVFLFFLALVSYFAFRIRHSAKRWHVNTKEGIFALIGSIMALPIVNTGRWLSQKFSAINVLVLVLDFIIETPFKFVLNFGNQFIAFLKEKSEELR